MVFLIGKIYSVNFIQITKVKVGFKGLYLDEAETLLMSGELFFFVWFLFFFFFVINIR